MEARRYTPTDQLAATLQKRERSQRWLARKAKVSPSLMSFAIRGERTLSEAAALRAAAALGEEFDELFRSTPQHEANTEVAA
jgi:transcriptional regulator with XRE-family HTH domain